MRPTSVTSKGIILLSQPFRRDVKVNLAPLIFDFLCPPPLNSMLQFPHKEVIDARGFWTKEMCLWACLWHKAEEAEGKKKKLLSNPLAAKMMTNPMAAASKGQTDDEETKADESSKSGTIISQPYKIA